MTASLETKACQACAKAKRKCGKERPGCARCRRQGLECTYPPTKQSSFVLLENDDPSPFACKDAPCLSSCLSANTADSSSQLSGNASPSYRLAFQPHSVPPPVWFHLPSTWQVTPWPQAPLHSCRPPQIKRLVSQIQEWFAQWVSTGSSPFMHAQLYRHRAPQCVQDAYTALSAYLHRTPENEHLVFQIFEARVTQLLAEHRSSTVDTDWSSSNHTSSNTLGHLARVQTLTTYLLVMLFNGDIRLRHVAEPQLPVLEVWTQQMVETARTKLSHGSPIDTSKSDELWQAWVLAESLRRTFLVARSVVALYEMLKAGKPMLSACKGGMVFTVRKGAWDATSAAEWEQMAVEVDLGLMQVADARIWMQSGGICKGQVDPFARLFVEGAGVDGWS